MSIEGYFAANIFDISNKRFEGKEFSVQIKATPPSKPCNSLGSCTVKDNCSSSWVLPAPEMPQISVMPRVTIPPPVHLSNALQPKLKRDHCRQWGSDIRSETKRFAQKLSNYLVSNTTFSFLPLIFSLATILAAVDFKT